MKILKKSPSFQRTIITLVSTITIFSLVAPSVATAGLTDDLTLQIENMLTASDDITAPLLSVVPEVMKFYVIAITVLAVSTSILEWEITNPNWIDLNGIMVKHGWDLTRGLANMFLLLIFLIVAFGFILRIESLESQKALPRLIIVALLLNFSKLFVGMLVDIATIANNTIMYGHEKFLSTVMEGFLAVMYSTFSWLCIEIISRFTLLIVPFGSVLAKMAMIASLATKGVFISSVPIWTFQIVAAAGLTAVFCIYIILFAARVYIVQILAILSPLAFLCLILPQTQKYWDEWLKHLIQWCFVGTILLFFLMLGLNAGNSILPSGAMPKAWDLGWFLPILNIPSYYLFYSFLFIYLMVTFWMVDRTMPVLAVAIMGMGKSAATKVWQNGGEGAVKNGIRNYNERAAKHNASDKENRDAEGNLTLEGKDKYKHYANSALMSPANFVHRLRQTTPRQSMRKYQAEDEANLEKHFGKDSDGVERAMETMASDPGLYKRMDTSKKLALTKYGMKYKGTEFLKDMEKKGILDDAMSQAAVHNKGMVTEAVGYHPDLLTGTRGQQIKELMLKDSKAPDELARQRYINPNASQADIENDTVMALGVKKILDKPENIKNLKDDVFENQAYNKQIVYNANSGHIQKIGENFGQKSLDSLHEQYETQAANETLYAANPKLAMGTVTTLRDVFAPEEEIEIQKNLQTGETKLRDKKNQIAMTQVKINNEWNQRNPTKPQRNITMPRDQQTGQTQGPQNQGTGRRGQANQGGAPGPGAGPRAGAGTPPGGGGGTTGRQTRAQQPNQSNLGDFGRGQTQQTTTPPNNNAAGQRTRTQQPNQSNLGDIGRGRDRQRTTENLRDVANRSFADFQREGQAQPNPDGTPRANTTPSGRTTGVHPDDTTTRRDDNS